MVSMAVEMNAGLSPAARGTAHATRDAMRWCIIAVLFAAAMLLRHVVPANTDVSWLLTVGERLLDGQTLYRDIIETNPPKAVLVYIPGLVLARLLGLSAEHVTDGLVFAAIAVSLGCVARLLRGSSVVASAQAWPSIYLAVIALAIVPAREFAQREHIAILELLPALAVLALRANRETPPRWGVALAGLGLGLALSFKPHFALAIVGTLIVFALYLRSWRLLFAPEHAIATAVVAAYAAVVVLAFPDYLTVIGPLARDVYVPTGLSMIEMLRRPVVLPWAIALIAACALMRRRDPDVAFVLTVALAVGFAIVFFIQRKGWSYHALPMMVFALLALGHAIARTGTGRMTAIGATTLLAVLLAVATAAFNTAFDARPLQAVLARLGPNPTILAISSEPALGHPLTRELHGTWVSRQQGLWVAGYAGFLRQRGPLDADRAALLNGYAARERDWLIADIRRTPPSVVMIDNLTGDWGAWVAADPELSALLAPYTRKQTLNGVEILSRAE